MSETATIDLAALTAELERERGELEQERQRHALDAALGSAEARRSLASAERRISALDRQLDRLSLAHVEQERRQAESERMAAEQVKAAALAQLDRLREQSEADRAALFRAIDQLLPMVATWDASFLAFYSQAHQCREYGARPPRWDHRQTLTRYLDARLGLNYVAPAERFNFPAETDQADTFDHDNEQE